MTLENMADKFLFVDSSPAGRASADKRLSDARSFVIRRVRAQQKATPKEWKFVHREDLKPATSCWGSPSEVQDEIREVPESASQSRHSGSTDALPLRSVSRTTLRLSAPEYGANSENGHAKTRKRKRGRCSCFTTQPEYGFSALCAECAATTAKALFRPSRSSIEGLLDPFDSVAVPLSARTKTLIAYCMSLQLREFQTALTPLAVMNGIAPNLTPMVRGRNLDQLHRHWLAPSFRHPAFMHSILCLTALQYCIRNPDRPPYEFMYHRIQAVAAVQRNLSNPSEALREENIAAVFNLLCVEDNVALCDLYGVGKLQVDSEQRVVHLNGLKRMIKSKGGIRSLGKLKGLQSFLVRYVCTRAVVPNTVRPDVEKPHGRPGCCIFRDQLHPSKRAAPRSLRLSQFFALQICACADNRHMSPARPRQRVRGNHLGRRMPRPRSRRMVLGPNEIQLGRFRYSKPSLYLH